MVKHIDWEKHKWGESWRESAFKILKIPASDSSLFQNLAISLPLGSMS